MKHIKIFSLTSEYETAKSGGTLITPNVSLINEDNSVRYLPELEDPTHNGYKYVDLGLPSGLKWAKCNVGASSPEEYGLYFAWGETTGYTADDVTSGVRLFTEDEYDYGNAGRIYEDLTLEQDAAHVNLGGNWRMPTQAEFQELIDNCDDTRTDDYNGTGVAGLIFTSRVNGNSVFFPYAGFCEDSSVYRVGETGYTWAASWESASEAYYLWVGSYELVDKYFRRYGYSVRGVFK